MNLFVLQYNICTTNIGNLWDSRCKALVTLAYENSQSAAFVPAEIEFIDSICCVVGESRVEAFRVTMTDADTRACSSG